VAAYRTVPARGLARRLEQALRLRGPRLFLASPSSVEAVRAAAPPERLRRLAQVLCLGQSTAQAWEFQRAPGVVSATLAPRGLSALEAVLAAAKPEGAPP
jgi:uroporphyrinogen-III synthase